MRILFESPAYKERMKKKRGKKWREIRQPRPKCLVKEVGGQVWVLYQLADKWVTDLTGLSEIPIEEVEFVDRIEFRRRRR